jgi:dienelactone hydrolase
MRSVDSPSEIIDQGEADAYAQWFYDRLDPLTHVQAYCRNLHMRFLCGAEDSHVPADGAQRFRDAFSGKAGMAEVTVDLVSGLGHMAAARDDALYDSARDWLTADVGLIRRGSNPRTRTGLRYMSGPLL